MDPLGVVVECPTEADPDGPIPIRAVVTGDVATNRANNSILTRALTVALIRTDAPGLSFLSTVPPNVSLAPDPPFPPGLPGDPPGVTRVLVERTTVSPLDHGAKHDGYAEYTVIAAFATWTDGPKPLVVKHPSRRLAWHDAAPAPAPLPEIRALPEAPKARGIVAAAQVRRGKPYVEGAFRAAIPPTKFEGEVPPPAFVTIFAPRMEVTGGAVGRSFVVTAEVDGGDYVGRFSIPLSELSLSPMKGKYRVYVFAGHEAAAPFEVLVDR
jgi:hypothetical protein